MGGALVREIEKASGVFSKETQRTGSSVASIAFCTRVCTELNKWPGPWEDVSMYLSPAKLGSGIPLAFSSSPTECDLLAFLMKWGGTRNSHAGEPEECLWNVLSLVFQRGQPFAFLSPSLTWPKAELGEGVGKTNLTKDQKNTSVIGAGFGNWFLGCVDKLVWVESLGKDFGKWTSWPPKEEINNGSCWRTPPS